VLQAVGHTPDGKKIAVDKAGRAVTNRGVITVHGQIQACWTRRTYTSAQSTA